MKRAMVLFGLLVVAGCTMPNDSREFLASKGYTQVEITGYDFVACSRDDVFHTGFSAVDPNGRRVRGTVCGAPRTFGAYVTERIP